MAISNGLFLQWQVITAKYLVQPVLKKINDATKNTDNTGICIRYLEGF